MARWSCCESAGPALTWPERAIAMLLCNDLVRRSGDRPSRATKANGYARNRRPDMAAPVPPADLSSMLQFLSTVCQICTALIAATIGVVTFRYTKQQSALTLINQNNSLANV